MTRIMVNATEGLEITEQHGDQDSVLRLRGRLNIDSSPDLRDWLLAILRAESPRAVIVDLTDVTYIDSSGIATLIEGLKMGRKQQTTFHLQGLQGRLLHLFQVTGVLTLFESGLGSPSSASKVS
jgi:anti-sigma B factor antagonist